MRFKKWLAVGLIAFLLLIVVVFTCNYIVIKTSEGKTYNSVADIPHHRVGLVLGTTPYLKGGGENPYFTYRINAVVALYKAEKIDFVLVSGDNGTQQYNEPEEFKRELIKRGIPSDKIVLDYAGFRTLDSIVRAKAVFDLQQFTVISQEFHNQRAIYIAKHKGIDVVGFNAKDLPTHLGIKTQIREYLARTKVILDIIFDVQPKFYGEKITIE